MALTLLPSFFNNTLPTDYGYPGTCPLRNKPHGKRIGLGTDSQPKHARFFSPQLVQAIAANTAHLCGHRHRAAPFFTERGF
jgi:hypothetical protein